MDARFGVPAGSARAAYIAGGANAAALDDVNFIRNFSGLPANYPPAKAAAAPATSAFPRTVTVNVNTLNVRSQPTSQSATAGSGQLLRGNTFVVTNFVIGENVSGENRWWVSQFGNYVWVGGTTEKP